MTWLLVRGRASSSESEISITESSWIGIAISEEYNKYRSLGIDMEPKSSQDDGG